MKISLKLSLASLARFLRGGRAKETFQPTHSTQRILMSFRLKGLLGINSLDNEA
jgi:hypothetical protein